MQYSFQKNRGFTLIELLIVVAILALLASIAVPNFLEAQIRAKVSRAKSDLRSLATAMEAYRVDNNEYPPSPIATNMILSRNERLAPLTTPIAYMTGLPNETFLNKETNEKETFAYWSANLNDAMKEATAQTMYYFLTEEKYRRGSWVIFSRGPDLEYEAAVEEGGSGLLMHYDPTNGSVSNGDIMRFGP
jgi:type II secretion system protein G